MVVHRIEDGAVEHAGVQYWGQFLNAPRRDQQFGIYGTCAAVEVLASEGNDPTQAPLARTLDGLPLVGGAAGREVLFTPADLALVFKVGSIVTMATSVNPGMGLEDEPVRALVSMAIDHRGWGHYVFTETVRDAYPSPTATAFSLIALARVQPFRAHPLCRGALEWLASALSAETDDQTLDSLGLLALASYRNPGQTDVASWQDALTKTRQRILRRPAQRRPRPLLDKVDYHYQVAPPQERPDHAYMFFIPAVIGALALLNVEDRKPEENRYVLSVVKETCAETVRAEGFPGGANRLICTLDQLWVYRLVRVFEERARKSPVHLLPFPFRWSGTRRGRMIAGTSLLTISIGGIAISLLQGLPILVTAVASFVGAVAANVLATAFRFPKRD